MSLVSKILIIAGSDPSSGAGLQADIKTACKNNVYASVVVTSLTAQNTQEVTDIFYPKIDFLKSQFETIFCDIDFDAIKIGMLGNKEIVQEVARNLNKYATNIPIILDPVIAATSGDLLLSADAIEDIKTQLITKSFLITPNIDEAQILSEIKIKTISDMKQSAQIIKKMGAQNVLIKGGHLTFKDNKIRSILLEKNDNFHIITNQKIGNKNLHGTGCTLASAITSNIAKKDDIVTATRKANQYVYRCIKSSQKIGKGSLILQH